MKELKTLDEHNAERRATHGRLNSMQRNGIACPKCGAELWDSEPDMVYTSNPPQKSVECYACGYEGYRVA